MTDPNVEAIERLQSRLAAADAEIERLNQEARERVDSAVAHMRRADAAEAAVRLALPLLEQERRAIIECHSDLEAVEGEDEPQPVPGTLEPGAATEAVAEYDAAIEACKSALAAPPATEADHGRK